MISMNKKCENSIYSLYEIRGALLGLSGLFTNAGESGMSVQEIQGIGALLTILSAKITADLEAIEGSVRKYE